MQYTKKQKELRKLESKNALLNNYMLKPTDTLIIVLKSVSRSGMCCRMRVLILMPDNRDISWIIEKLCDLSINNIGLRITGCGMDMAFWLAEKITQALYRDEGMSYADYQKKCESMGLNKNVPCLSYNVI